MLYANGGQAFICLRRCKCRIIPTHLQLTAPAALWAAVGCKFCCVVIDLCAARIQSTDRVRWFKDNVKNTAREAKKEIGGADNRKYVEPPSKKPKSNATGSKKNEEEPVWELEKKRFVKVREFKGKVFVDIREYYEADGELKPGKKGISLSTMQWHKLKDIVDEVDEVVKAKC
uniref:Transcriptional coactivator p15 (PC4) C-terminal domain-containing protein n=1 Tax=Timema bartmani TaxID=61472 RepID=A0A7R9F966_9NEOP|nr:unnamed protein product [Timema bartmani]